MSLLGFVASFSGKDGEKRCWLCFRRKVLSNYSFSWKEGTFAHMWGCLSAFGVGKHLHVASIRNPPVAVFSTYPTGQYFLIEALRLSH